uniref:tRNA/rRNA methyltransferase SpoU type domain-containing protein n=1 Tax=Ditylum brightwellii TaxID=49249 RepID=A0A7S1YY15_9STRA
MEERKPPPPPSTTSAPKSSQRNETTTTSKPNYQCYLLLENPKKSNNLGPILRCAAAYAVDQVIFVGYEKCSTDGSHGAAKHVSIVAFPTFDQAVQYLRKKCDCTSFVGLLGGYCHEEEEAVAGLELSTDLVVPMPLKQASEKTQFSQQKITSWSIQKRSFQKGNNCFILSKNWRGLPKNHAIHCDSFVHIPQISVLPKDDDIQIEMAPFQFLDVPSCLSIALHHFTAWARFQERNFEGQKFQVVRKQHHRILKSNSNDEDESLSICKKARIEAEQKQQQEECMEMDTYTGGLFDSTTNSSDY